VRIDCATLSEPGQRAENQDRVAVIEAPSIGLVAWAIADGLGGHAGGDVAAEIALAALEAAFHRTGPGEPVEAVLSRTLSEAAAAVRTGREDPRYPTMGTTIAALAILDGQVAWGHAGDSRIYRLTQGAAVPLTVDHSFAEAMRRLSGPGEAAGPALHSHALTSALGQSQPLIAISTPEPLELPAAFLLCSDGFWEPLSGGGLDAMAELGATARDHLDRARCAIDAHGDPDQDNYSAVLVRLSA
jgi:serine/threonine protein phosphatase PrpC